MISPIHPMAAPPGAGRVYAAAPQAAAVDRVDVGGGAEAPAEAPSRVSRPARYAALAMAMISAGGVLAGAAFLPDLAPRSPAVSRIVDALRPKSSPAANADSMVWARQGRELSAGSVLKPDAYPGIHTGSLQEGPRPQPLLPGAHNFRQLEGRQIFGVGQPTVQGLRNVLDQVGAGRGGEKTAYWTNMREEPVVYVNGRPFNVRELSSPFANREAPGLSTGDLEAREKQLQAEVRAEVAAHGGRMLIHEETADGNLVARWEKVESVQTPGEVYEALRNEGYRVDYARIPVTDEQSPEPGDFDALRQRLTGVPENSPMIFNCHAGRGRTTTAMVAADLLTGPRPARFTQNPSVHEDIREQGRYQRGEYRVILSLIEALKDGPRTKAEVDAVIDRSSALQNLRESIEGYKDKSERPGGEAARERGEHYLKRYFMLLNFDAYTREQAPQGFQKSFQEWLQERPELGEMLERMELAMGLPAGGGPAYA